ncbi:MAG: hypothetical protein ACREV7_16585 [Steroidobacteraceae bacterium]
MSMLLPAHVRAQLESQFGSLNACGRCGDRFHKGDPFFRAIVRGHLGYAGVLLCSKCRNAVTGDEGTGDQFARDLQAQIDLAMMPAEGVA